MPYWEETLSEAVYHVPIMAEEVLSFLQPEKGGIFVDGTLGGGGHAEAVLRALPEGGRLIGIDRDEEALESAGARLAPFGDRFCSLHGNFFRMKALLETHGVFRVNGILLDLGVSSHQLDDKERGFSYMADAPLDMRMDRTAAFSAYDVVNGYSADELKRIFWEYGEEKFSGRAAQAIVKQREEAPIRTTLELAELIKKAIPASCRRKEQQHPARRCFQAIRIEVNHELDGLEEAIRQAHSLLVPGGRLVILTFHSLEDRIVKNTFRSFESPCTCPPSAPICICGKKPTGTILTRKPLTACEEEQRRNSRSTCCKLRAEEKREPQ